MNNYNGRKVLIRDPRLLIILDLASVLILDSRKKQMSGKKRLSMELKVKAVKHIIFLMTTNRPVSPERLNDISRIINDAQD